MNKISRLGTPLFAVGALSLAIAAVAEGEVNRKPTENLEETQVWGTRVQSSSVFMGESDMSIKQADHLSDLMRTIPGVDIGGAHSLNQRIAIRSLEDKDLLVTIDGVNQNTYMYHHMGNLQIHTDILQSIEVEVGTNSVIDSGLGGAVRFETKDAQDLLENGAALGGRVQASYANNASQSASLTGYGELANSFDYLVYYNHVEKDNYEVGGGKIVNEEGDVIEGTDGKVRGMKGDIDDALLKFGWNVSDSHRLELGYESYADKGDYSYRPDMGLATDLVIAGFFSIPLTYDTEFTRDTARLGYEFDVEDHSVKATLFRNDSKLKRDESALSRDGGRLIIEGTATNMGLNVIASSKLNSGVLHNFTYGAEFIRYETSYERNSNELSGEEATNSALFVQDRIEIGDFAVIPGVRYDSYNLQATLVDETFSEMTGALAFEYEFFDSLVAKLSSTQLFKGPEVSEVFIGAGLDGRGTPSEGIEAETGINNEFSLAYQDDVFGADVFSAGVTLFDTEINNYIYDSSSNGVDNVGDMAIDGYELYVGYELNTLSVLLSYSSAESELSAFAEHSELDGTRIDRKQGDTFSLNVDYEIVPLNMTLHWDVLVTDDVKAEPDLGGANLENSKEGFSVHNVSAQWYPEMVKGLTLTFGIDNLFDEFYASQSSRTGTTFHPVFDNLYLTDYEPGRNIKSTIAYQF